MILAGVKIGKNWPNPIPFVVDAHFDYPFRVPLKTKCLQKHNHAFSRNHPSI